MKGHLYIISDFPDDYTHTPQGQLGSTASTGHNPLAALPISPSPTIICNNNKKKKCTQQPSVSPPAPRCFLAVSSSLVTQQFLCKCYTSHGRGGLS